MRGALIFEQCGTNPIVMLRKAKGEELPNTSNVGQAHITILTFPLKLKVRTCESLCLFLDLSNEGGD
jgi:hypothetical protein